MPTIQKEKWLRLTGQSHILLNDSVLFRCCLEAVVNGSLFFLTHVFSPPVSFAVDLLYSRRCRSCCIVVTGRSLTVSGRKPCLARCRSFRRSPPKRRIMAVWTVPGNGSSDVKIRLMLFTSQTFYFEKACSAWDWAVLQFRKSKHKKPCKIARQAIHYMQMNPHIKLIFSSSKSYVQH